MDEKDIERKIEKILDSKEIIFKNKDTEEDRKTKIQLAHQRINEILSDDFSNEPLEITQEKIEMKLKYNLYFSNVYQVYMDREFSDYGFDLSMESKQLSELSSNSKKMVSSITAEVMVQKVKPEDITLEMIDKLKYIKKDEVVIPPVFYNSLEKYLDLLSPHQVDENLLKYLHENNYQGKINNPMLAYAYINYCDEQNQNKQIKKLEDDIKKEKEILSCSDNIIKGWQDKTNKKIEENENLKIHVNQEKDEMEELQKMIRELSSKIREEQSQGFLSKLSNKVKKLFSKDKNEEKISDLCQKVLEFGNVIEKRIIETPRGKASSVVNYKFENGKVYKIDSMKDLESQEQKRERMITEFYSEKTELSESENIEYKIESDINMLNHYANLLEDMYQQGIEGPFPDKMIETAYKLYCRKKESDKKLTETKMRSKLNENLISYDGKILDKLKFKYDFLQQHQQGSESIVDKSRDNFNLMRKTLENIKETQENEEKKSILNIIKDGISGMLSKRKSLPKGENSLYELDNISSKTASIISQLHFKQQSFDYQSNLNEINQIFNQREAILTGKAVIDIQNRNDSNKGIDFNAPEL